MVACEGLVNKANAVKGGSSANPGDPSRLGFLYNREQGRPTKADRPIRSLVNVRSPPRRGRHPSATSPRPRLRPFAGPPVRLRDFDPLEHQRLVVNPFLAVFGLIVLVAGRPFAPFLVSSPWPSPGIPAGVPAAPDPVSLPRLRPDRLLSPPRRPRLPGRPRPLARGTPFAAPFPSSRAQLVVWGWLLGSVAVLLAVLASSDRHFREIREIRPVDGLIGRPSRHYLADSREIGGRSGP